MDINLIDDPSVSSAPAGFNAVIAAAAQFLDTLITNPITVNISVGWGETDGQSLSSGDASTGGPDSGTDLTYSQLKGDLTANAVPAADKLAIASLPTSDPTNGGTFYVSSAQEKAWGLLPATGSALDGSVGFNTTLAWNYNTSGAAVLGKLDLVTDAEVELAHALGMIIGADFTQANVFTALDLFRYSSSGGRELAPETSLFLTMPAYFSIDSGKTDLGNYDTTADSTLWTGSGNDAFNIPYTFGVGYLFSPTDATELNALGLNVNAAALEAGGTVFEPTGNTAIDVVELPANCAVTGGGGHDTIVFDGSSSQYTIANNAGLNVTVADSVTNRDSTHLLIGVEALQFTDRTIFVEDSDNANIARLYSAALDRAPDSTGLFGWEDIYVNNISATAKAQGDYAALAQTNDGYGTSIAGGFTNSAEFQSLYGTLSNSNFVDQLYENVLARTPSPSELNAWLTLMTTGDSTSTIYTQPMVLVGFAESTENIAKTAGNWLIQI